MIIPPHWCAFCAAELTKKQTSMFCDPTCRNGYRRVQNWLRKLYPPFQFPDLGDIWIDHNPLGTGYIDHDHKPISKRDAHLRVGAVCPEVPCPHPAVTT